MKTQLGEVYVLVNSRKVKVTELELSNISKRFHVDKRYKLVLNEFIEMNNFIDCIINFSEEDKIKDCIESGERLELISFYKNNIKLSIGTEGEIQGIKYEYLKNGLRLTLSNIENIKEIIFYVAWLKVNDKETEDIYTWFAADPTLTD